MWGGGYKKKKKVKINKEKRLIQTISRKQTTRCVLRLGVFVIFWVGSPKRVIGCCTRPLSYYLDYTSAAPGGSGLSTAHATTVPAVRRPRPHFLCTSYRFQLPQIKERKKERKKERI